MTSPSTARRSAPPPTLTNRAAVRADLTSGGALRSLQVDGLSVLQYPAGELEDGLAGVAVRIRDADGIRFVSLFGQQADSVVPDDHGVGVSRRWEGLSVTARFRLADDVAGWVWSVRVVNEGAQDVDVDVVHTQDVALAPYGAVRTNELYVSQYLDLTPVEVPGHGVAVAVRQNMPGGRAPWALVGCLDVAERWSTDALQLDRADGSGGGVHDRLPADLPAERWQHEHTLVGLQTPVTTLAPGESLETGFYGIVLADHPEATSPDDARHAHTALADPAAARAFLDLATSVAADPPASSAPAPSLFARTPELPVRDVDLTELATLAGLPDRWTEVERDGDVWLSAFAGRTTHVVSAAKERTVLRPHGHVMRTGAAFTPDERSVTTTTWMRGGFHSQVTQGHVALGSVLSLRRSYLDLFRANGIRVFVAPEDRPDDWRLLGMPSAWSVAPDRCRWWYRTDEGTVEVVSSAPADDHALGLAVRVVDGPPVRLLVALHVALGQDDGAVTEPPDLTVDATTARLTPPPGSDRARTYPGASVELSWSGSGTQVLRDEPLFADGRSRDLPWLTLTTGPVADWTLSLRPRLVSDEGGPDAPGSAAEAEGLWDGVERGLRLHAPEGEGTSVDAAELARIDTVLPWFAHDALVHYLSPRGLEQYTGGGWGTRDVSQGPVGLLLAFGEHEALRDVVVRLLRAQHARGDWPQAFDFLARHRRLAVSDAHGDVVYWPLLAIGDYLVATGDRTLLEQAEPMVEDGAETAPLPLLDHLDRALDLVEASRIPGTTLPAYGHGDWNDSLQPADPRLAAALCSTWTVTLQAQALTTLAAGLDGLDGLDGLEETQATRAGEVAARARRIADEGVEALRAQLFVDDVLAGYGRLDGGEVVEHLIHPRDRRTGLTYSVLPMIHAIAAEILTPDEAHSHLAIVHTHLTGPDGVRLFDRPAAYHGGPMEVFQRAEASTFFGREIGIMYTHAHLRYAEALARMGDGPGLLAALAWVNPLGMPDRVAPARRRQSTTYFSSSDAAFPDRATADRDYERVRAGSVALEGGWRVYSSGPGLYLRLVRECLLGIRVRGRVVEVDPVLPPSLDGLTATVTLFGRPVEIAYRVGSSGHGPTRVRVGDHELPGSRLENRYRTGGLGVPADDLRRLLDTEAARIDVEVS